MSYIYARGYAICALEIMLPTPALSGSGSSGMISARLKPGTPAIGI